MQGKILVYGNDSMLLMTRRLVLERAGCRVLTATKFADAMLMLMNQRIDVLIVCHSLRDEERQGILETARALNPDIRLVILRFEGRKVTVRDAEYVEGLDGPGSLLEAVHRFFDCRELAHGHMEARL